MDHYWPCMYVWHYTCADDQAADDLPDANKLGVAIGGSVERRGAVDGAVVGADVTLRARYQCAHKLASGDCVGSVSAGRLSVVSANCGIGS